MNEAAVDRFTEEIEAPVLHLGQFDTQPLPDIGTGQFAHGPLGRPQQQEFYRYVEFVHQSCAIVNSASPVKPDRCFFNVKLVAETRENSHKKEMLPKT